MKTKKPGIVIDAARAQTTRSFTPIERGLIETADNEMSGMMKYFIL